MCGGQHERVAIGSSDCVPTGCSIMWAVLGPCIRGRAGRLRRGSNYNENRNLNCYSSDEEQGQNPPGSVPAWSFLDASQRGFDLSDADQGVTGRQVTFGYSHRHG